ALLSGLVPVLPALYTWSVGFNIGVITYHNLKGKLYYAALLNPVALFELPAAFIVFTMAFQFNLHFINIKVLDIREVTFNEYINVFISVVIPLLTIASIVETTLIVISKKINPDDNNDNDLLS
ncbi:MAG: stage II sporulation protein M, partial [Calditrichaceae bacterium]|nr:stage II sporulation protein M [Calditrichaceae bacterium]